MATSPRTAVETLTRAATPRPSATMMAVRAQPSITCRAVSHRPCSPRENAVPALVSTWPGTSSTLAGANGEPGEIGTSFSPGTGGGAGGASARSCRPLAAIHRAATTAA